MNNFIFSVKFLYLPAMLRALNGLLRSYGVRVVAFAPRPSFKGGK